MPQSHFAQDPPSMGWRKMYEAALLETDTAKLKERVSVADTAIVARIKELSGQSSEELSALTDAIHALNILRRERQIS